jgi:Putative serine esterase (DUF676)
MTKIRRALTAVLAAAMVLAAAAPALAAGPPPPADSFDEPVYLIKGYGQDLSDPPSQWSCSTRWSAAIGAMHKRGWVGQLVRVGFYAQDTTDTGCDVNLTETSRGRFGTQNTSIRELGRRLANNIYNVYSSKGKSIDLMGHSMGGLIIRAALAGYQRHERGWPPLLFVEDAVTLGTPHEGAQGSRLCFTRQCKDMRPGSGFMNWLAKAPNPQASGGTDWTLIGASDDGVAPPGTSTSSAMKARHVVTYRPGQGLAHSNLRTAIRGRYRMSYSNDGVPGATSNGASPIKAAQHALFWATRW